MAIGPRDLESATVELTRRDTLKKQLIPVGKVGDKIPHLLRDIQNHIFNKALAFRNAKVTQVQSYPEFKEVLARKGGFLSTLWDGSAETESSIQQETGATIRCIPQDAPEANGTDPYSGKPAKVRVLYAKAY